MVSGIFDQANYAATKRSLDATMLRHEAIASNIANIEVPNYKRLEVDGSFQESLKTAMKSGDAKAISQVQPQLALDRNAVAMTPDGNNVQLETEMVALQQNTMAHAVESHFINGNLLKLRLAITGRSR